MRDVRLRQGETRRSITLPIKRVAEDLTVGRDRQSSALDPRGNAFSTVLTREQIAALPDDPDEMEQMLKAMAPPGATLRIDGFTGGKLPPKSQIRSIRLPRMDMFAAQNHGGLQGMMFIDVMTQPGNGPLRGSADLTFRDEALNARNPFTPVKGEESMKQGGGSISGTIVPNKSSFWLTAQKARLLDSGNLLAAGPDATLAAPIQRPIDLKHPHTIAIPFQLPPIKRRKLMASDLQQLPWRYIQQYRPHSRKLLQATYIKISLYFPTYGNKVRSKSLCNILRASGRHGPSYGMSRRQ